MTEPITTPEMLVMQERLRDLSKYLMVLADRIDEAGDEVIDDADYTAEMMRLQAEQVRVTAEQLEDSDDIAKVNLFISRQEIEARRLEHSLDKVDEVKSKRKKGVSFWQRRQWFWTTSAVILGACAIFQVGFSLGRLAEAVWAK